MHVLWQLPEGPLWRLQQPLLGLWDGFWTKTRRDWPLWGRPDPTSRAATYICVLCPLNLFPSLSKCTRYSRAREGTQTGERDPHPQCPDLVLYEFLGIERKNDPNGMFIGIGWGYTSAQGHMWEDSEGLQAGFGGLWFPVSTGSPQVGSAY